MRKFFGIILFLFAFVIIAQPFGAATNRIFAITAVSENNDNTGHYVSTTLKAGILNSSTGTTGFAGPNTTGNTMAGGTGGTTQYAIVVANTTPGTTNPPVIVCGAEGNNNGSPAALPYTGTPTSYTNLGVFHYPTTWPAIESANPPNVSGWIYYISATDTMTIKYYFPSGTAAATYPLCVGSIFFDTTGAVKDAYWAKFSVSEQSVTATSVDSRQMYGVPNSAGEVPAQDPNSPPRNVTFTPSWWYKGGLFTGHAEFVSGDQSGTSRIQAWISSLPTGDTAQAACLTLYYLLQPTNFTDNYTLQAYAPASTDPNLSVGATSVNWSTAWNPTLTGVTTLGSAAMNQNSATVGHYISFNIADAESQAFAQKVMLALSPEPFGNSSPNTWSYFTNQSYENIPGTGVSDQQPRAWCPYLAATSTWVG